MGESTAKQDWTARNRERVREQHREYMRRVRRDNPEKIKQWQAVSRKPGGNKERDRARNARTQARLYEAATRPRPDVCEVCGSPNQRADRNLHFDHDHETGLFRGWLCALCNLTLGNARNDPALLRNLADYLERAMLTR